jgi:hypothetical protein
MPAVSAFLPWVLPHAYGVTDNMAGQAIVDACIEFCERTGAVQGVWTADVVAGRAEVDLEAPSQQEVAQVKAVFLGAVELRATAVDDVRHGAAARAGEDTVVESPTGTPQCYYQRFLGEPALYLWPVPDSTALRGLSVRAAFRPARTATQVDDRLYNDYVQSIAYGALSRILVTPGQPFTNPTLAKDMEGWFNAAIAAAASDARRGNVQASMRVRPRAFA